MLALVFAMALAVDPDAAALQEIETGSTRAPNEDWETRAEALTLRASAGTSARAHLWLGARALQSGRLERSKSQFSAARLQTAPGEPTALAWRGLGDVALAEHAWYAAITDFQAALAAKVPILERELTEKALRARRELALFIAECAAWVLLVLCLGLLVSAWRGHQKVVPVETRLLAPVYALFVAAAWGRDSQASCAILLVAVGSLLVVTAAFAAVRRWARLDLGLVVLGNLAVLYLGLRRAGILDALWETLKFGTDMG